MKPCEQIRPLLALFSGQDLGGRAHEMVVDHLRTCTSCRSEAIEFKSLIDAAQGNPMDFRMDQPARRRIAHLAAAGRVSSGSVWTSLIASVSRVHRTRLVAAMTAAAAFALVAIPIAIRDADRIPTSPDITKIDVVQDGGVVRLAWSNGSKETYTVYKSDNPKEFSARGAHMVRGNIWTDEAADSAQVVFYRIE